MLLNDEDTQIRNVMGNPLIPNPRNANWFLYTLYFLFKIMRMYFVIWAYYFTPVTALALNLYYNMDLGFNSSS